jgi:hypothetical protein
MILITLQKIVTAFVAIYVFLYLWTHILTPIFWNFKFSTFIVLFAFVILSCTGLNVILRRFNSRDVQALDVLWMLCKQAGQTIFSAGHPQTNLEAKKKKRVRFAPDSELTRSISMPSFVHAARAAQQQQQKNDLPSPISTTPSTFTTTSTVTQDSSKPRSRSLSHPVSILKRSSSLPARPGNFQHLNPFPSQRQQQTSFLGLLTSYLFPKLPETQAVSDVDTMLTI